jgi:hypothetical protein
MTSASNVVRACLNLYARFVDGQELQCFYVHAALSILKALSCGRHFLTIALQSKQADRGWVGHNPQMLS